MPLEFVRRNDDSLARDVSRLVAKAIATRGVPVTAEQANALVDALYPRVAQMRRTAWRAHVTELGRQAAAAGVEIRPEPLEPYPRKALYDAIADISRLTPDSTQLHVMMLDEETKKRVLTAVTPTAANRGDKALQSRISSDLGRRLSRHVIAAGRNAVADAAHNGSAKFTSSGAPAHAGYARVLSGRESCAFCAMLASRGAVYQEDTVVTRKDGRRYHDGCDCIPVLVVENVPWEGEEYAEALYEQWQKHTWSGGKPAPGQFKRWAEAISAGDVDATQYSPFSDN